MGTNGKAVNDPAPQFADRELQELHEELERTKVLLEQRAGEIECVRHLVAHDLRAPLRTIDAFSRILLEEAAGSLSPESKDHLERIHRAVGAMEHLLEDALAFLRPLRTSPATTSINLSRLASQILNELRGTNPARQAEIIIAEEVEAPGDEELLYTLLRCLLDNAWKFTSRKPFARIEFGTLTNADSIVYFVRDNGAGFDTRYKDKLFLPFQRLHSTSQFPGNGIGLAMAQRIVRHLGGRIWAEAEVGQGATFFFALNSSS